MNDLLEKAISTAASLISEGRLADSEVVCRQILVVDKDNPVAMTLLSCCLERTGNKEESKRIVESLSEFAESAEIQNAMGIACMHARETQKAIAFFESASKINPQDENSKFNTALCFMMLGQPKEALDLFKEAYDRSKSHKIMIGMACAKTEMLDLEGAEELLRTVLKSDPENSSARTNIASVLHLEGKWDEAWEYYTSRLTHYERLAKIVENLNIPLWKGGDPPKGKILVFSEQGTGDAINFGRMALCLSKRYPDRDVSVFVSPQLRPMMERQGIKTTTNTDGFDACCSMMDLPGLLNMSKDDIKNSFVKMIPERRCDMSKFTGLFKVGICWAGNPAHPNDMHRSCSLNNFKDIGALEGVKLFSLQRDVRPRVWPCSPEPINLSSGEGMRIVDMSPHMKSWEDTAAIISSLDLVISVDTSVMHLAAAMDKETWGLLSYVPDWRWELNSTNTCWYPSLRLFRQSNYGDWKSVFSTVCKELQKKL